MMLGAPAEAALRRGWACAGWRAVANAVNERHRQILDFQKNCGLMIWSPERWFIPPWSLLFTSPMVTIMLAAVERACAQGPSGDVSSPRTRGSRVPPDRRGLRSRSWMPVYAGMTGLRVTKWPRSLAQPFEKARFTERKELGFCSPGLDFLSQKLGFSFPKAWIFLP